MEEVASMFILFLMFFKLFICGILILIILKLTAWFLNIINGDGIMEDKRLNCVKKQCPIYSQHQFFASYFVCDLEGVGKVKAADYKCIIELAVIEKESELRELKRIKLKVRELQ